MAGVSSISALETRLQNSGAIQNLQYTKGTSTSSPGGIPYFLSRLGGGQPGVLAVPTTGRANGTTCSSSTSGALMFSNSAAGVENFIFKAMVNRGQGFVAGGAFMIVDRLAHVVIDINADAPGSYAITGVDGTARLASGEGGMIMAHVVTALGAGSNQFTLGYTNQAGTASRTTAQVDTVASRVVDAAPWSGYQFLGLQGTDTGVRSIETYTQVTNATTGVICIAIVKPLIAFTGAVFCDVIEKEFLVQALKYALVPDNACLEIVGVPNSTNAATYNAGIELFNI